MCSLTIMRAGYYFYILSSYPRSPVLLCSKPVDVLVAPDGVLQGLAVL